MVRIAIRHVTLAMLPLCIGIAAGWVFISQQPSCGSMVGPLFAAKCGRRLIEYQLWFQTMGTVAGTVIAVVAGIWLERQRGRKATRTSAPPSVEPSDTPQLES